LKFALFLFCIVALARPAALFAQLTVNFQPAVTITGSRIVLGDIAVIGPAGEEAEAIGQLPVAVSPAPGKTKELYTVSVINSLRNRQEVAEVDWQGSQTIVVRRQGTFINRDQLQAIIDQYLKENSGRLAGTNIRFTAMRAPEELTLPAGKLSWTVTPSRPGITGSSSFSIAFAVDDKPATTCVVRGRLEAVAEVVTAAVRLNKGDVINDSNIAVMQQDIGGLNHPYTSKEQLIGMQVARTVNAGTVLEQAHIAAPPIVKDGEMVKIFARKGALQLSTSGLAKTDGRLGEIIQVKNIGSNKLIHCRVDGPGMVSVEF
jgi:flagella basal body P-ring formation protein FlgA